MWTDEIVEKVRQIRETHAAANGHDLRRIFQDLKRKQDTSGQKTVTLQPRTPRNLKRAAGVSVR